VKFIEVKGDIVKAWEGYKVTLDSPTRINHIATLTNEITLDEPTSSWSEEGIRLMTIDPWYRRTDLTGLTLKCIALPVKKNLKISRGV